MSWRDLRKQSGSIRISRSIRRPSIDWFLDELPIVGGIYAKSEAQRWPAIRYRETKQLVFGVGGGLVELRYAAAGFLLVRRGVYEDIQTRLGLPVCNERVGRPSVPFFQPMVVDDDEGPQSLSEDVSFCAAA